MMQMQSISKKSMPQIIAICGAKRSGKDVLADYICGKYNYNKIRFADPLKTAARAIFNFSEEQVGDGYMKDVVDDKWGIAPRKILQFLGTEVLQYKIQELLPDVDRKLLAYTLVSKLRNDKCYVISDMRFIHEYEEMAKLGALVIRVDRPQLEVEQNNDIPVHPSEIEYRMIPYHMHIKNDGDIAKYINIFEELFTNNN